MFAGARANGVVDAGVEAVRAAGHKLAEATPVRDSAAGFRLNEAGRDTAEAEADVIERSATDLPGIGWPVVVERALLARPG